MYRPPPSSPASLPSLFFAFLAHASVVVAGVITLSGEPMKAESTPMVYIPIDLVEIADSTNLTAVARVPELTDENREQAMKENEAAPPPGAPPPEEDVVSFDEIKPKEVPKKTEAKTAPAAESDSWSLEDALKSAQDWKKTRTPSNSANTAPAAANEAPRQAVGKEKRELTASVTDVIRSQLISNRCWADHSDMADARRLKTTIRVWFGRNGKFSKRYEMIAPTREPMGDPPLQAFITHARRALDMCNNIGWVVPEEYFTRLGSPYIDIDFLPAIGAMQ